MPNHQVNVSFANGPNGLLVSAVPNPAPSPGSTALPGDTATFTFSNVPAGANEVQIGFDFARNRTTNGPLKPVGPLGPFLKLERLGNQIIGTVDQAVDPRGDIWRYFCKVFINGHAIPWDNATDSIMFDGGFDTPRQPPP